MRKKKCIKEGNNRNKGEKCKVIGKKVEDKKSRVVEKKVHQKENDTNRKIILRGKKSRKG